MKFKLNETIVGIDGEPIKNFTDSKKIDDDMTLRELFRHVLITERTWKSDRSGLEVVNEKDDKQKYDDFMLVMKVNEDNPDFLLMMYHEF